LTRRANAALKTAVFDKRLLQWMELAVFGESFDGFDLFPGATRRQGQTGTYQTAIDDHAAGAANADAAAFFGTGQAEVVAQNVKQQTIRFDFDLLFFSIDVQQNRSFHVYTDIFSV
jgi:hypothetical protein